jgi:hypothetical protein
METKTTFTFTQEELNKHDEEIREEAYHKAAENTVKKIALLLDYPILDAIKKLFKYAAYLSKTYNLE